MSTDPRQQFEQAVGGWRGALESAAPALAFLIAYQLGDLNIALWVAGGLAVLAAVARLVRRESLQFVIGGAIGVALSAWFVSRSGKAEDFFLPDMLKNAAYFAVYLVSVLVRYPLIGVLLGAVEGEPLKWIRDADRRRTAMTATLLWVLMFGVRIGIMFPLYWANELAALGIAKIALGYPLFVLVVWLTYRLVRPWYRSVAAEDLL
jgi:hypothetical protein